MRSSLVSMLNDIRLFRTDGLLCAFFYRASVLLDQSCLLFGSTPRNLEVSTISTPSPVMKTGVPASEFHYQFFDFPNVEVEVVSVTSSHKVLA